MTSVETALRQAYEWLTGVENGVKPDTPPAPPPSGERVAAVDDGLVVNGVRLSPAVLQELRMLGIPLAGLNAGELQDAVLACAIDTRLVDDEEGVGFRDMLVLTEDERRKRQAGLAGKPGFVEKLAEEREPGVCWGLAT